jgi:ubiquinone/menaquinone biosynthesis C-methylase UbiE
MLEVGKKRAIERGIFDELQFMVANAEMLTEI